MRNPSWSWWTGLIAVVCGTELVIAVVIGGAGIGVFFGLDGAFVAVLSAATLALMFRSWRFAMHRPLSVGIRSSVHWRALARVLPGNNYRWQR